jgi:hypothetical protein
MAMVLLGLLVGAASSVEAKRNPNPGVLPVGSTAFGQTLAEWSAEWWKSGMEQSLDGNAFAEGRCFELPGHVWALAGPLGTATVECAIPPGKALLVPAIAAECSSLEPPDSGFHGDTAAEQAECAKFWADHIVDVSVEIDGVPVNDIASYRVVSPQFAFTAPTPWIFGAIGGAGTSVGDGYYLMLTPRSKGVHTIRIRGAFHFSVEEGDPFDLDLPSDMTFRLTVGPVLRQNLVRLVWRPFGVAGRAPAA